MPCPTCHCCSAQSFIPTRKEEVVRKMQCYQRALRKLSSQFNKFLPIFRLPDEVLCKIFAFYRFSKSSPSSVDPTYFPYGFIRITHVCQYWRNVAMNFSPLCDCFELGMFGINNANAEWAVEQLRRSNNLPLTINAHIDEDASTILSTILKQYWHRIQTLHLRFLSVPTPNEVDSALQGFSEESETISILHTLSIRVEDLYRDRLHSGSPLFRLPSRSLSQIRELTMINLVPREIAYFLSSAIRTFEYHYASNLIGVTVDGILDLLDNIPNVEHVVLDTSISVVSTEPTKLVTLPFLTALSVTEDDIDIVLYLLRSLDIRLRHLKVSVAEWNMDPNFHSWMTIIELATAISNILGSGNIDTERRKKFGYLLITLNPESTHTISLRAWPLHVDDSSIDLFSFSKGLSFSYIREMYDPNLDVTIPLPSPYLNSTKKFAEILNFNTIRILEINATQGKPFRVISPEDTYQWA
ncbi:hypothetical protein C8Q75DRAFT_100237 [Abortiporus biennis]|nr:hypothetical protein C8Q75DRAFT_100237 [Abortiporus biennis]